MLRSGSTRHNPNAQGEASYLRCRPRRKRHEIVRRCHLQVDDHEAAVVVAVLVGEGPDPGRAGGDVLSVASWRLAPLSKALTHPHVAALLANNGILQLTELFVKNY